MANRSKLTEQEIAKALESLPGWSVENGKLHREYHFRDFTWAFGFMAAAATAIEKMDHHPDWRNVYGRVTIDLHTHEAGGITGLDLKLAAMLEEFAHKLL